MLLSSVFFFFNDTATTEIYTLSLHDALPISMLKEALAQNGRDPATFPISKRIFLSVHENAATARTEVLRWFTEVYHNPPGTDECAIHGTPEQVREQLEELASKGATHLMLNPTCRYPEQVEALAEVTGLK